MLGIMFEKGRGVPENYPKALLLFRKAAMGGGLAEAQFNLGRMYEGGKGVEVNPVLAKESFLCLGLTYCPLQLVPFPQSILDRSGFAASLTVELILA